MSKPTMVEVPPKSLDAAIQFLRDGGRLVIPTYTRVTVLDARALAKYEAAGLPLLREEGDGYRLQQGRGSVYLFAGQLRYVIESES